LKLVHFETLNQFNFSSFEIYEFNLFNQILLDLFDVSYAFQDCYLYCLTHFCFNVKSNIIMKHA